MSESSSRLFRVRIRGPLACFTRPEMKVERVSYEVMTPSAARGVLEAILWKPAIVWRIHEIVVLSPIQWTSFRRNEINERQSIGKKDYCADADRAQRNTVALRDVDYVVTASFQMTSKATDADNVRKFEEMFERRLAKGQTHHQPYLGCREFAADVSIAEPALCPPPALAAVDRPLGMLLYDLDYSDAGNRPLFFAARLQHGVLRVPSREELSQRMGVAP